MNTVQESDQVVQRRANLEELKKLGVESYPRRFEIDAPIADVVRLRSRARARRAAS